MPTTQKQPQIYNGLQRKLVISFDVGTTFSGASYAFLIPGESPVVEGVTQFPGQQKVGGDSKIPSVVCYDGSGDVVAVGPETNPDTNSELMVVEGLVRAEWFKLHLRPAYLVAEQGFDTGTIRPLPPNKTVIDVFADLLRYLYKSTKQYIRDRQGNEIWECVGENIEFILSHPNGWEGKQQSEMRRAAISGGLVPNETDALKRVSFVTEGEASLHFCLRKTLGAIENHMGRANDAIMVVDCGGGTIDISTYAQCSSGRFREVAPAECLLQGSFFVSQRAQAFLTEKLRKSKYGTPEDIEVMTRYFDETTKPAYKGSLKPSFIRFGRRENDPDFDIRSGSIVIDGPRIAEFFEPAIQSIIQVIEQSILPIRTIFMVGGFATSDYLFPRLVKHFDARNMRILRPDAYLNKAVAEGAISFNIDHSVTSRISRYTYGVGCCRKFDPNDMQHIARKRTCFVAENGEFQVPGAFSAILMKDTEVSEETEFRGHYSFLYTMSELQALEIAKAIIKRYQNRKGKAPAWIDEDPNYFFDLCEVTADVSRLKKFLRCQVNKNTGAVYYELKFDIVLLFGLTEVKAQIAWIENGVEKRGPAYIAYDITSMSS
ncbi:hypothetical protein AX15_002043 [Amanita polypyramis BW_CC]|nr:hypothetical protein AX15_002043 [Amanita polypyramis BW_CC]